MTCELEAIAEKGLLPLSSSFNAREVPSTTLHCKIYSCSCRLSVKLKPSARPLGGAAAKHRLREKRTAGIVYCPLLFCSFASPDCFVFALLSLPSYLSLSLCSMPITEQEAILWGGNATADQLSAIPEPRIGRSQGLKMLEFSTAVIHSFYGGPAPPLFPFPAQEHIRLELESWCRKVLEWNDQRRQSVESDPKTFFYKEKRQDEAFLKTFGYPSNITSPTFVLLRVSGR